MNDLRLSCLKRSSSLSNSWLLSPRQKEYANTLSKTIISPCQKFMDSCTNQAWDVIKSQGENKMDSSASSVTNIMHPASSVRKCMWVPASSVAEKGVLNMDLKMNPHLIEKHASAKFCQWRLVYSGVDGCVFIILITLYIIQSTSLY